MAETVLSIARSTLGGAVKMAASAAATEMGLLMGVRKDIWFIRDELKTMQAFLLAAEGIKKKDMLLKVWAEQVRDLSYGIEDCLDEFMVHVATKSLSQQLMKLKDRHQIAIQIRDLKSRVEEVSIRNTRYNLIDKSQISNTGDDRDFLMEDIRNQSANNINEAELVGFTKPKQDLINLIDVPASNGHARVVCVVGMGGLGKTTITRQVYENIERFSCRAWIVVSQSFVRMELLKVMIKELFGDEALKKQLEGKVVREVDLASYLRKELNEERYFVVLDDLWNIDDWEWIKMMAFPSNNTEGSRIIVTTRDVGLAKKCTSEPLIYHLETLKTEDATNLLLRKTNIEQNDMENDENLMNIVKKLVKKCGCLPLAILTIGGILATKKIAEWEDFYDRLPSELESNLSLEAIRRMVTLSYDHLPSHLKPCLLYLGIFPEDFVIKRKRLVDRWMAEGLVRARDIGEVYFTELLNRSMIQPSRVNIEGTVKSCRVHDIMRDIIVAICREENFICTMGDDMTSVADGNFRHIAYHGSKCPKVGMDWNHVRSLTLFGGRPMEPRSSLCSPELRMLRVLDLQSAQFEITQKDINNIGLLHHMKYVSIWQVIGSSCIYALPRSIGKLKSLQTLIIEWSYITTLPTEICKLLNLCTLWCSTGPYEFVHGPVSCLTSMACRPILFTPFYESSRARAIAKLHVACSSGCSRRAGVKVPKGISNLKKLEVLGTVDIKQTSRKAVKELGELTRLRKLTVATEGASKQKCKILGEAIEKLSSLCYLSLEAYDGTFGWMDSLSSPLPNLKTLKLHGVLGEIPDWIGNLTHLVKIHLFYSQLKEGKFMEMLGALPKLMLLHLDYNAYVDEKLVFRARAFPNLRKLNMVYLKELREVKFEEGTSPQMEKIEISGRKLESGIIGIENLPRLKEISINWCRVAKLAVLEREVAAHSSHPVLRLLPDRSKVDLDHQGSNVAVEATESLLPDPVGDSSQMVTPVTNVSADDLLYAYNSC